MMGMDSCRKRVGIVLLVLSIFAGVTGLLYLFGPHAPFWPKCLFHQFTGMSCPGCGMTRATNAALHGQWALAFRYNPVLMILLPVFALGGAWELIGWLRGKPMPIRFQLGKRFGYGLLAVILVFWVLRNIPHWPFTLLAPPG